MSKLQRFGLTILLITLIMVTIFTNKPGLTESMWSLTNITAAIMAFIGGVLFISD